MASLKQWIKSGFTTRQATLLKAVEDSGFSPVRWSVYIEAPVPNGYLVIPAETDLPDGWSLRSGGGAGIVVPDGLYLASLGFDAYEVVTDGEYVSVGIELVHATDNNDVTMWQSLQSNGNAITPSLSVTHSKHATQIRPRSFTDQAGLDGGYLLNVVQLAVA